MRLGGGVPTNVLHYLDILTKELVDQHILLHYFQNAIDEGNLLARTLKVPHKLVEGLDCGFLLPAPPRGILDEISHHLKVLKGPAPVFARELCWVSVDKATFLTGKSHLDVVPEAYRIAEGEIEEDDVSGSIQVLTRFQFDRDRALGLRPLGHLEESFSEECGRITGAAEVKGRSEGPLSLVLDGVEKHLDILFPKSPLVIEVREVSRQVAHRFRLLSLPPVQDACQLVPLLEYQKAVGEKADQSLLNVTGLQLEKQTRVS